VRSPPDDLSIERLREALATQWRLADVSLDYVPEGGGSHHWRTVDRAGSARFVTVDDLDNKSWFGDDRSRVAERLHSALLTATALRDEVGLGFVVAPLAAHDGALLHRLDDRYTVSVYPYLSGRAHAFGPYTDPGLRRRVLGMLAELHAATPAVGEAVPAHVPDYTGREELRALIDDPVRPWTGGPLAGPAQRCLSAAAAALSDLVDSFDGLVATTARLRADTVVTHGEPHPANLMSVDGAVLLIDWDTVALAPPERDLSLLATGGDRAFGAYEAATGRAVHGQVVDLYRLRWYLDDVGSAARTFSRPHRVTPDTQRRFDGLAALLDQLPIWLARHR
jgi:spectinomycin phosphotransferase